MQRAAEAAAAARAAAETESQQSTIAQPEDHVPQPANTVVPLPRRDAPVRREPAPETTAPAPVRSAQVGIAKGKKNYIKISAMLAIALPTALATLYYGLIAAPQYVAEARFAVRGPDAAPSPSDALSALTGLSMDSSGTISDSYIVSQFILSSQIVGNLQRSVDLRSVYTNDKADFIAKYRPYDFEDTIEHLTTFWNSVAWIYFDPVAGTITLTVRAFTPEDSLKIARETVRESEKLVNKLSERSREDAIALAKQEMSRAELRLKFARKAVQDYRDRMGQTDPMTAATAKSTLIAGLEQQLATQEADIAGRTAFLSKDAPSIRVLRQTADALRSQIEQEKAKIGSVLDDQKKKGLMSASLSEFEALQTERDFAQRAYEAAATAVESARVRAEQQTRYLATYVEPHLPEDSLYPARLQMVLLVLLSSALAWAVGVLIFYGIRDHTA
ncbi:MAG: hypothetical protein DI565_18370 [Ancylobacter novellus]|uniref:Capsule biosynthesis protein n=1 Tax=Ancylobacter novellus TaxID=921 RepID=A0A2W5M1N3_ANCNO|nr:MAG: hypothetical protein DI565_18370 [Ancylobacter novellus]